MEQEIEYAAKIQAQLSELFNEECENHIDFDDFKDDNKLKAFLHALASVVPCNIYNKLTGSSIDNLQFNYVANQLVFEYSKLAK